MDVKNSLSIFQSNSCFCCYYYYFKKRKSQLTDFKSSNSDKVIWLGVVIGVVVVVIGVVVIGVVVVVVEVVFEEFSDSKSIPNIELNLRYKVGFVDSCCCESVIVGDEDWDEGESSWIDCRP